MIKKTYGYIFLAFLTLSSNASQESTKEQNRTFKLCWILTGAKNGSTNSITPTEQPSPLETQSQQQTFTYKIDDKQYKLNKQEHNFVQYCADKTIITTMIKAGADNALTNGNTSLLNTVYLKAHTFKMDHFKQAKPNGIFPSTLTKEDLKILVSKEIENRFISSKL